MAKQEKLFPEVKKGMADRLNKSPFFSRAYGGYTLEQKAFYESNLGAIARKVVFDPMAGQGFHLAELAYRGAKVWLGDLNPAMSLMASLRSPEMLKESVALARWMGETLQKKMPSEKSSRPLEFVDEWIAPSTKASLAVYRDIFKVSESPYSSKQSFWELSLRQRFAAALPLLAARQLSCYRQSDNQTWSKPGGLLREVNFTQSLLRGLSDWASFASYVLSSNDQLTKAGELNSRRIDASSDSFKQVPMCNSIVTSPPYANRLDYTRMWGPESEVAAALWNEGVRDIKTRQIGSNVIRGTNFESKEIEGLPQCIVDSLNSIRNDSESYASADYYYPFFRNYAVTLTRALRNSGRRVKRGGLYIVFVRDTVRKDILFPSGQLVEEVLKGLGYELVERKQKIIRRHVGLRRRRSTSGLYGIGQQEWWLSYRRGS